jgi:hypothetical protein
MLLVADDVADVEAVSDIVLDTVDKIVEVIDDVAELDSVEVALVEVVALEVAELVTVVVPELDTVVVLLADAELDAVLETLVV